ncbi:glutathione reductase [Selenomonas massiliensis]|uniref:glutathione reductase n=1 Tax=Selenomonas massiliensis TaxID=2058293 RepID=UPI000D106945|nr:glutathione reductase [Selenomonas massiliensis]
MEDLFQQVRSFLVSPAERQEEFDASDTLIWVDWGDEDESVLSYLNDVLPEEAQIDYECVDSETERGFDILLKKDGEAHVIPYATDAADRDTTLKAAQEYLAPTYEIRWYMGSLGSDTLAFAVLSADDWQKLEREFGAEQVTYYFPPIHADSQMFEMDVDEVFDLLEQRKQ